MIGWGDVYKVVSGMAPLYFALVLGYCSVRWWKLFTRDQCDAINRLVIYFALPFFAFDFNAHAGTFAASYRVLAADAVAKLLVIVSLAFWAAASSRKAAPTSYSWCITGFSLATLSNGLLVGAPLMDAMYGKWARDIVVQLSVVQAVLWLPVLLVVFEARQAWMEVTAPAPAPALEEGLQEDVDRAAAGGGRKKKTGCAFWGPLLRNVGLKVVGNPNVYASLLGVLWSIVANRWNLEIPLIIDGSIEIMSKTGLGIGMFNMGLFIGLQDKIIMTGPGLTTLGMVLRFVAAPATTMVGAILLGLRGDVLRVAIIQAALPQSVGTFFFAREYDLHADVLSTAVIAGTLVSLPVITGYYVVLGFI
ncbi:probable auxin efflux carrier component 5b [Lolium rigidum]|uniref:probable auxin efflux carrier component 5b n=1 Tax=Lolium rigidum TaxID=89674 RepID=UPI001F5E2802|nr:probable auxin efflux carrier component 5b [Lolium rigidum]